MIALLIIPCGIMLTPITLRYWSLLTTNIKNKKDK